MKTLIIISFLFVFNVSAKIKTTDLVKIENLLPTTYYLAQEETTSCKGKYGDTTYDGTEISEVKSRDGKVIAKVCTRFYKVLCMEGSGLLKDRGQGTITVNWAGKFKFEAQTKCKYGHGVRATDCLLSHHTIAADNKVHKIGDIIYIPDANGLILPDGTIHQGYFIVLDTGGSFVGIGGKRVDLFVGLETDYDNIFKTAGFSHKKPIKAYKVIGNAKKEALKYLKEKFGDLLSDRHFK